MRTAGDYGLRFTVTDLTQLAPLSAADLTFWGFPADASHDGERFPKGAQGEPSGCPRLADASCSGDPVAAGIGNLPLINNPSVCTGQPLLATIDVTTYQDPATPPTKRPPTRPPPAAMR